MTKPAVTDDEAALGEFLHHYGHDQRAGQNHRCPIR